MITQTEISLFDRVVCGVDRSDAGIAAARAAARLTAPDGALTLVSVNDPSIAVHAGWDMARLIEDLAAEAQSALERGRAAAEPFHDVETRLAEGDPVHGLLTEIERQNAGVVVVGSHGLARATGIALGAVSTHLLHRAHCPVLVARGAIDPERWPRRIVVGVDGSFDSARAYGAARELAERFGAELRAIVATHGNVDLTLAHRIALDAELHEGRALDVLNVLSERADLVVLGSRGLRGLRALGSVSERLAHEAKCSVLVVRPTVDE